MAFYALTSAGPPREVLKPESERRRFQHLHRGPAYVCLCWGLTSQSTIFQSCRDGATASWAINQYFRWVKCLAQGHNTAAVGFEPPTSHSRVRHSTIEPSRSPRHMLMYQKVCILLNTSFLFSLENFGKIASNILFTWTYNGAEKHVTCKRFENDASRAKTNIIATVHFTDDDVKCYDGPRMLIH